MANANIGTCCQFNHAKGGCSFTQVACGSCPRKLCPRVLPKCQTEINEQLAKLEHYRLKLRLLRDSFKKRDVSCECCGNGQTHTPRREYCHQKAKLEAKIAKAIKRIIQLKKQCRNVVLTPNKCKYGDCNKCNKCTECDRKKTFSTGKSILGNTCADVTVGCQ